MRDEQGKLSLLERIVGVATVAVVAAASSIGLYGCDKKQESSYERPDKPAASAPAPDPSKRRRSLRGRSSTSDITNYMDMWEKAERLTDGDNLLNDGKKKQAIALYEAIAQKYPDSEYAPKALTRLNLCLNSGGGYSYSRNPDKNIFRRRVQVLELLVTKYPDYKQEGGTGIDTFRTELAILYGKLGDKGKAEEYLSKVDRNVMRRQGRGRHYSNAVEIVRGKK